MIWMTSDLHFMHNKPFLYEPRGFDNIYDMNETIIKNFNEVVSWNDDLYILGDIMLNDNEEGMKSLRRLPGRIHIIRGNHDTDNRVELFLNEPRITYHGWADVLKYNGHNFFLSHYPTNTYNVDDAKRKKYLINLYGHTHQQTNFYNDNPFMYHVGVDSHNCYPVHIEDIMSDVINKISERQKEK